jgi:hypothetical protein
MALLQLCLVCVGMEVGQVLKDVAWAALLVRVGVHKFSALDPSCLVVLFSRKSGWGRGMRVRERLWGGLWP